MQWFFLTLDPTEDQADIVPERTLVAAILELAIRDLISDKITNVERRNVIAWFLYNGPRVRDNNPGFYFKDIAELLELSGKQLNLIFEYVRRVQDRYGRRRASESMSEGETSRARNCKLAEREWIPSAPYTAIQRRRRVVRYSNPRATSVARRMQRYKEREIN